MKRFKIGFLALVALVAMSFTISENAGLLKKEVAETVLCYRDVEVKNLDCSGSQVPYDEGITNCPGEINGLQNKHVFALDLTILTPYSLVANGKPAECGISTAKFCCVTLDTETPGCPGQPSFDLDGPGPIQPAKYKVVRTFCKPQ